MGVSIINPSSFSDLRSQTPPRLLPTTARGLKFMYLGEKYNAAAGTLVNNVGDGRNDFQPSLVADDTKPTLIASPTFNERMSIKFNKDDKNILEVPSFGIRAIQWTMAYVFANSLTTPATNTRVLFSFTDSAGTTFNVYASIASGKFTFNKTGGVVYDTGVTLANSTKYVCVLTYDANTAIFKFWVNGTLVYTSPATLNLNDLNGALVIGGTISRNPNAYMDGVLGGLYGYNRILANAEITALSAKLSSAF